MKLLILMLLLSSCAKDGLEITQTNNSEFEVAKLFTNGKCTVYRFHDNGNSHYYTDCSEVISRESYQCGKSRCSKSVSIKTKEN